jgi:hypothetical protein
MLDNKILYSLLGMVIAIAAISYCDENVIEGFLGNLPNFNQPKQPSQHYQQPIQHYQPLPVTNKSIKQNIPQYQQEFYQAPVTQTPRIAPREFGTVSYGTNISYNSEHFNNEMKKARTPLGYSDLICGDNTQASTMNQNIESPCDYVPPSESTNKNSQSYLPVGNMSNINNEINPIIYDRIIYSSKNSRLRSQGDMIRGDLPIVPNSSDWFRPSVKPSLDLQEGAMNIMGGSQNETSRMLTNLINTYKTSYPESGML